MDEPIKRPPLPIAYADPAFMACLLESIDTPELVAQFNRLYGATLGARATTIEQLIDRATGKERDDMRAFTEFVHFSIYTRIPDEAIHSLRAAALAAAAA